MEGGQRKGKIEPQKKTFHNSPKPHHLLNKLDIQIRLTLWLASPSLTLTLPIIWPLVLAA